MSLADLDVKFVAAMPFVAAILVYLISPQLSKLLRHTVAGKIEQANSRYVGQGEIPEHLSPSSIGDYVEYAGDAAQVLPSTFLVVVGVVAALFAGVPKIVVGILLIASIPCIIYIILKVLNTDPSKYVRRGGRRVLKRYTYVTAIGIMLNLAAVILVLIFVPEQSSTARSPQPEKAITRRVSAVCSVAQEEFGLYNSIPGCGPP